MRTEDLLMELDKMIEEGWSLPLSRGKIIMNAPEARKALKEIKISLPEEVRQAKAIASDRSEIIKRATKDAHAIIKSAEDKARRMMEKDELIKRAKAQAFKMKQETQNEVKASRLATQKFVYEILHHTEELLISNLEQFRKITKNLFKQKYSQK
ncbi:MAG: hypothetical protein LBT82_00890 [Oscillospiraceae bacterium]|nr:hypothetical protein [Oscillospiraceae bacterium]